LTRVGVEAAHCLSRVLVLKELVEYRRRDRDDVRPGSRRPLDVEVAAYAANQDLAVVPALDPAGGGGDQLGGIVSLVRHPAGEHTEVGRARLRGQHHLVEREDGGRVDLDPFLGQRVNDLEARHSVSPWSLDASVGRATPTWSGRPGPRGARRADATPQPGRPRCAESPYSG